MQNLHGETSVREQVEHDLTMRKRRGLRRSENFYSKNGCLEYAVGCWRSRLFVVIDARRGRSAGSLLLRKNLVAIGLHDAGDLSRFERDPGVPRL